MSEFASQQTRFCEFVSFSLLSSTPFKLTLSARPPVLDGDRGAIRGGDEGGGSFSPAAAGASAPAAACAPFASAPPPAPLLRRLLFHSPRLRLSAEAEPPFPCEGGSGGQAPSESCGDEAIFLLGRFEKKRKKEEGDGDKRN